MARLKFLAFALVALGLWAYHLTLISPLATANSVEQAQAAVAGAAGPVTVALESRRSLTQAVALKVAAGPAAWNPGPKPNAKPEAPTVDRFAAVRSAAMELVPAPLQEQLVVALHNDVGVLVVKGAGEPATAAPEGFELAAIVDSGTAGAVRAFDGVNYLFFATPLVVSDKNEVREAGHAVVGLPVLPDASVLDATAKSLGLKTVALVADGKPVLVAGDKAAADEVLKAVKANGSGPIGSGPVREVGPLALPLFTDAPHAFGARVAIAGTPFEVAALAASRSALESLAGYQVFGFGALAGLLLFALVMTIVMGGSEEPGAAMVMPPPMPIPPVTQRREESLPPKSAPLAMAEQQPAPEASPDDFDFPMSSPSGMTGSNPAFQPSAPVSQPPPPPVSTGQNPIFEPEPTSDPFATSAPPPPPPPAARPAPPPPPIATTEAPAYVPPAASQARGPLMDDDEAQRTVAYPVLNKNALGAPPPSADPFAMAAASQGYDDQPASAEDNPEATRVAAVPAELIRAARASGGNTAERPALSSPSRPPTAAMPKVAALSPAGGANDEERHFQDVFRDFVSTREKCREPADGLTYDKFKAKLLKNKEQLVAKYNCKSVRFQVYVKDGKAALKATPVKD